MSDLASKQCMPCQGGVPPLTQSQCESLLAKLDVWEVVDQHHLKKRYRFPDFVTALDFVNKIGAIAEEQGHHPNISFTWGWVEIKLYTHKIDGLSESDFILAAKIDRFISTHT